MLCLIIEILQELMFGVVRVMFWNPSYKNKQKLPKWNRRARMGQFLGYSRVHSSTVALVRNLHTGFVSPQYHVVFDDKFETVFNDGRTNE